jgi:ribosomal protein L37AE/L43A
MNLDPNVAAHDREPTVLRIPIAHCSEQDFHDRFRRDLTACTAWVLILSPFLAQNRVLHYYPIFYALTARQVVVEVYAKPRHEHPEGLRERYGEIEHRLKDAGARFHVRPGMHEKLAVIDGSILWHGSLNMLSHNDTRESMLRFESPELIQEVLTDLRLEPYAVGGKMLHVVEMEDSTSASREITVEMPRCPKCGEEMLFFANASMWICKISPRCSGTLIAGATISKDQKAQASRESGQKLELVCPLCGHPMEISRGVFVRVMCSSPACGFTLDTRLSMGILRMLHRREIV